MANLGSGSVNIRSFLCSPKSKSWSNLKQSGWEATILGGTRKSVSGVCELIL